MASSDDKLQDNVYPSKVNQLIQFCFFQLTPHNIITTLCVRIPTDDLSSPLRLHLSVFVSESPSVSSLPPHFVPAQSVSLVLISPGLESHDHHRTPLSRTSITPPSQLSHVPQSRHLWANITQEKPRKNVGDHKASLAHVLLSGWCVDHWPGRGQMRPGPGSSEALWPHQLTPASNANGTGQSMVQSEECILTMDQSEASSSFGHNCQQYTGLVYTD